MITVPLESKRRRRALAVQRLNHAVPAFGLILAGQQALATGADGFGFYLGVFEIISAAALIALTARELRGALRGAPRGHETHGAHHRIDWVDIAAGCVLVAEALEHWHVTHHVSRPTVLMAAVTFGLGLNHGRVRSFTGRRRTLRVDDEGITIPGRPFKARKLQASWAELRSVDLGPRWAVVTTRTGRSRKLDLADLENEAAVRGALIGARNRIPLSEGDAMPDR